MLQKTEYKKTKNLLVSLVSFLLVFCALFIRSPVHGVSSLEMNFSGKIVTSNGLDISSNQPNCILVGADTCDFQIKYYDDNAVGTLLGKENFIDVELGDYRGYFNLKLGGGTYISGSYSSIKDIFLSEEDVYIEVLFDGSGLADFEFTNLELERFLISHDPVLRMAVGASPYAISARGALDEFQLKVKTSPVGTSAGLIYFDGGDSAVKVYDGSAWQSLVYESMFDDVSFADGNITALLSADNLPDRIGTSNETLTAGVNLAVGREYVFVTVSGSPPKLRIYDVSSSTTPTLANEVDLTGFTNVYGLQVVGNKAYILADDSFLSLDISNVKNVSTDSVALAVSYTDIPVSLVAQGRYAYVVDDAGGVFVIDLSQDNLKVYEQTGLPAVSYVSFDVKGDRLYAINGASPSVLVIMDISDPTAVVQLGSNVTLTTFNTANEILVSGRYGYISNATHLRVVDVLDYTTVTTKDTFSVGVSNISTFALSGRYAFILNGSTPSSLHVINIANASSLSSVGSVTFSSGENNGRGLGVQGKYGYALTDGGVVSFDLKGIQTNSLLTNSFETFTGFVRDDFSVGNNLLVSGGMQIGSGGIYSGGDLSIEGQLRIIGGLAVGTGNAVYINSDGYLVASSSSLRYKKNVESYGSVLGQLSNLDLVRFTWDENTMSRGQMDVGMIAEEVAKYIPDLVIFNSFGQPEGLKYEKMGAYAIAGLQELSQEFYTLRDSLDLVENKIYTSSELLSVGTLVSFDFSQDFDGAIKPFESLSVPLIGIVAEVTEYEEDDEIYFYKIIRYRGFADYEVLISRSFDSENLIYPSGSPLGLGVYGELVLLDEADTSSLILGYTLSELEFEEESFVELTNVYLSYNPLSFGFNSFAFSSLFSQDSVYNGLTIGGNLVNFQGKTGTFLILNTDMLNVRDRIIIEVEEETPRIKIDGEDLLEKVSDLQERLSELEETKN